MKAVMEDDKYKDLDLVEVAYGDDEPQKSTDQTQALLSKYPDLKVICSPTTVGINAAAKVIQDSESLLNLQALDFHLRCLHISAMMTVHRVRICSSGIRKM